MDYFELKIQVNPPSQEVNEVLIAQLAELGFESFTEDDNGLCAYIKASDNSDSLNEMVKELHIPDGISISTQINKIKDQNWNAQWESNFEPIIVDNRCLVRASFHKELPDLDYDVIIDPKMAFGTGHHQTTHLMIEAILNDEFKGKSVLDMGCGTGVLAILAEMKGASSIDAIDIDEWAYQNTIENMKVNGCKKITPLLGDVSLIKGKSYNTILANINLNILIADIQHYVKSLLPNGNLYLSGILKTDIETITKTAEKYGLIHLSTATRGEWAMVAFQNH